MPCLEYRELRCGKNCAVSGACREPVGSAGVCTIADLCEIVELCRYVHDHEIGAIQCDS